MTRIQMIEQVLKLYDENDALSSRLASVCGQIQDGDCDKAIVRLSALDRIAMTEGKKQMAAKYISSDWRWNSYAPKVIYEQETESDPVEIMPFEEWFEKVNPNVFDGDDMMDLFDSGVASFKEFKLYFKDEIEEKYRKMVKRVREELAQVSPEQ